MSTKVKGDKIKEGSIPLSALSKDVKYVTGSYDVEAVFDAAGTYQFNFSNYHFSKVGNNFVPLLGIEDGKDILINPGPPVYIRYEYNGIHSTCVITDVAGYITKERPVEIVTINKSNSLFLPDDIGGGADWNAQSGEPGYIDNKPFGKYIQNFHVTGSFTSDESLIPFYDSGNCGDKYPKLYLKGTYSYGDVLFETVLNTIEPWSYEVYEYNGIEFSIETGGGGEEIFLKIDDESGTISAMYGAIDIEFYTISKYLDDAYLPNTVIKTFPQTLSGDAQNQALANLGIERFFRKIKEKCILSIQYDELSFDNDDPSLVTGYSTGLDTLIEDIKSFIVNCFYYKEIGRLHTRGGKFTCTEIWCRELIHVNSNDVNDYNITNFDISFGTTAHEAANIATLFQISYSYDGLRVYLIEL